MTFANETPWNYFAQKNIAYLYAITNGTEIIWDVHGDNPLFPGEGLQKFAETGVKRSIS